MYVVVAYDVSCDRRRRRLQKALGEYLEHVQKSVFEGEINVPDYTRLLERVEGEIDHDTDTVRVYHICVGCRNSTQVIGTGRYVEEGDRDVYL